MENGAIEVSASDVEKAIERGLAQLGLARDQVRIVIVDSGSRGILGIGARETVVRLEPLKVETGSLPEVAKVAEVAEESGEDQVEPQASDEFGLSPEQVAEVARQTLAELLSKMGIGCEVVIRKEENAEAQESPTTLDVMGGDLSILIGRRGEVLSALQYITRLIVSREVEQWVNVVVDIERYKQRRANSLEQLAQRIAERVANTKQPVALEPMPPNERRVIHVALHDHPSVTTQSVGKGDNRKVTIIPRR
jgi:spoIIIJ-associated protein